MIEFNDFKDNLRDAVLTALDSTVVHECGPEYQGWTDKELPAFLPTLDKHAMVVARRINRSAISSGEGPLIHFEDEDEDVVLSLSNLPCAAPGLISYRYRGRFGWIMIGANTTNEAVSEARRSSTCDSVDICNLQVWDDGAKRYVPVTEI